MLKVHIHMAQLGARPEKSDMCNSRAQVVNKPSHNYVAADGFVWNRLPHGEYLIVQLFPSWNDNLRASNLFLEDKRTT